MRVVRKDDLAAPEEAGVQRQRARPEQDERDRNSGEAQRARPVKDGIGWRRHPRDRDPENGEAGDGPGAGREKADQQRDAADDGRQPEDPHRGRRLFAHREVRAALNSRGDTDDGPQQQQPDAGRPTGKRREESLQAALLFYCSRGSTPTRTRFEAGLPVEGPHSEYRIPFPGESLDLGMPDYHYRVTNV